MTEKDIEVIDLNPKKEPELPPMPKPNYQSLPVQRNFQPMPRQERIEQVNRFNNNPSVKENGLKLVSKKWFYLSLIFAIIFALLFAGNIIWTNLNFSSGKLGTNINNTINVEPAQVQVPVNITAETTNENYNNFTIKIENKLDIGNSTQITLDNKTISEIVKRVSEEILSEINSS